MMVRLLRQQGHSGRTSTREWCGLVMRLHHCLGGKRIWCSPLTERREGHAPTTGENGIRLIPLERLVREQMRCPKTGATSLPPAELSAWPLQTLDLGIIEKDRP